MAVRGANAREKIIDMGALDCLTIRMDYFYLPWPKNEKIWKKIDFGAKYAKMLYAKMLSCSKTALFY